VTNIKVVVTDYIEPDLEWEADQFRRLGVDFAGYQLKTAGPAQLLAVAGDADVIVVNMARLGPEVIAGLPRCRLIIRHGVGYDNVDLAAASARGLPVTNIPDYCVEEVAEQAVMLMLACQRRLLAQHQILRTSAAGGKWDFSSIGPVYRLHGKTVGIVGLGRIGGTVFRMLEGFDVRRLVCDPYLSAERQRAFGVVPVPLEALLEQADIITLHTPLNAETHHLLDAPQFERMQPTAIVINTSRGATVNLDALDRALRAGRPAVAGIDVYEQEPPAPESPLLHNENLLCTPHLSWLSEEAGWIIRQRIVEAVQRLMAGEAPLNRVNPEAGARRAG
jgi:D-3-phosphoglycerate dehydrogenase / 2-oxoglutarate reductase